VDLTGVQLATAQAAPDPAAQATPDPAAPPPPDPAAANPLVNPPADAPANAPANPSGNPPATLAIDQLVLAEQQVFGDPVTVVAPTPAPVAADQMLASLLESLEQARMQAGGA
jgi:hypothetical protein